MEFIIFGENFGSFNISINFSDEMEAKCIEDLQGEEIWKWLEEKGYSDKLGELLLKSLFPALLSDFCQFIYEALSCSERARLTVAYSLLRKPLKENLAYLEWLLGDPEKLINTLYNEPASSLAIHILSQKENLIPVMRSAISRLVYQEMYEPTTIYELRYEKTAEYSFEKLWNKAIHLVTTHKELETEPQNLNFIFSGEDAQKTQWDFLYIRLPLILNYATDICESLMVLIHGDILPDGKERFMHRAFGWMACSHEIAEVSDTILGSGEDSNLPPLDLATFPCPVCGSELKDLYRVSKDLFVSGRTKCSKCGKRLHIRDFTNDDA